jgi:hypothetical protein
MGRKLITAFGGQKNADRSPNGAVYPRRNFRMETKRTIKAEHIVASIDSGSTDQELMEQYKLTPLGLQRVFKTLFDLKLLDRSKYHHRLSADYSPDDNTIVRRLDRMEVLLPVEIQDIDDRQSRGILSDLTMQGVGIVGIVAKVGQVRRFEVLADEYFQLAPFRFEGQCRWTKIEEGTTDQSSGFEITNIYERERGKLHNLIDTLEYLYHTYK